MKKLWLTFLTLALVAGLGWTDGLAQPDPVTENHYLVFDLDFPSTFFGDVFLEDQFQFPVNTQTLTLEKVGLGVWKNFVPSPYDQLDHTWWNIGPVDHQEEKLVGIDNQFGRQDLTVFDPAFLLNPAGCFNPPFFQTNHYLCYEAVGPPVNVPVTIFEPFCSGFILDFVVVMQPVYFCNPVNKTANGIDYPIMDPAAHITVYAVDTGGQFALLSANMFDQFGAWNAFSDRPVLLEVPTEKLTVVSTEETSWGKIKAMYDD